MTNMAKDSDLRTTKNQMSTNSLNHVKPEPKASLSLIGNVFTTPYLRFWDKN